MYANFVRLYKMTPQIDCLDSVRFVVEQAYVLIF